MRKSVFSEYFSLCATIISSAVVCIAAVLLMISSEFYKSEKKNYIADNSADIIAVTKLSIISGGSVDDLLSGVVTEKFSDYEETEITHEKVEVNFGEKAVTPMYTVLCDEIKEVDSYPWTVQKGYRYVAVHLVLTNNLSEEESLNEKTDFVVNGIAQDSRFLSGYKRISSSPVTAGLSIDGYLIFEIPTNITTAQLKYGDYVTINIKPSDIKSK